MDTPVQPATVQMATGAEPGVTSAKGAEGASFLTNVMLAQRAGAQPAPQPAPQPVVQPVAQPAFQPVGQPVPQPAPGFVAQPVAPQLQPAPQPMPQPAPQPVPPPAPLDYTTRYSGEQPTTDPLASLQEAPALAPEAQIAAPQNMTEQQNHAWAAMRAQSNANRRAAEEFRTKYNQFVESAKKYQEERASFGEQLNAKDKRIQELEDEMGRMDLTRSPAFQEKYDAPIFQVRDDIAKALVSNGKSADEANAFAQQVLEARREQLPDMLSELPTHLQGIIMVNAEKADGLFNARDQAISDWRKSAEGLAAVQERGNSVLAAQHTDKMAAAAIDLIRSMAPTIKPPAYQVVDPTFAAERDAQENKFRAWVQQAPEEQKYAAMLEGFMAPKTYEMLDQVMRENAQLKQVLAGRARLAAPPVVPSPGIAPAPVAPPPKPAPTVQTAGFSVAPAGNMARQFLESAFALPQGN